MYGTGNMASQFLILVKAGIHSGDTPLVNTFEGNSNTGVGSMGTVGKSYPHVAIDNLTICRSLVLEAFSRYGIKEVGTCSMVTRLWCGR